jgi:anti-sigma-K factor RskA
MDYSRSELADRLAAEFVLGTLQGPARRRMQTLLPAHPVLQAAVRRWEERLQPLAERIDPVVPSARVWQALDQRLFAEQARSVAAPSRAATAPSWWQRLGLWQGAAVAGFVASVSLSLLLNREAPPAQPPIVIVLSANPEAASAMNASFVASLTADGSALVLKPVQVPAVDSARALELWAVPAQGAPRSLGLVSASTGTTLQRAHLLRGTAAFAVSLEPAGGSPTGAPTGPIVSVGKVQL